jgi:hypothetical protein
MKRFWVILATMLMVMGITSAAMAGFEVRTAITSPSITGEINVCERYGALTFTFVAGTTFTDGDTFYMDLPDGAKLCNPFDFVIKGFHGGASGIKGVVGLFGTNQVHSGTGGNQGGTDTDYGPWKLTDIGASLGAQGVTFSTKSLTATGIFFRVTGSNRRVLFTVYDDEGNPGIFDINPPENSDKDSTLKIDGDASLTLSMFDANDWRADGYLVKDTSVAGQAPNGIYGDRGATDLLKNPGYEWENSICGMIMDKNTALENGQLVNVSFDSGGSFLTFQGQREIAHVSQSHTTAVACNKSEAGNIIRGVPGAGQGGIVCTSFDNETGVGYCAGTNYKNYLILENTALFEKDVEYIIDATILVNDKTGDNGVYFSADKIGTRVFNTKDTACATTGPVGMTQVAAGTNYTYQKADGEAATPRAANFNAAAANCSVADDARAVSLKTPKDFIVSAPNMRDLFIDLPALNYDRGIVKDGDRVEIQYTISKVPCGVLATGKHFIGTFGCAALKTCMYFPYVFTTGYGGWDCGVAISNVSKGEVPVDKMEVKFTFYASDGKAYTFEKKDFQSPVWAAYLNGIGFTFNPAPPAGTGWLLVEGNFRLDGFEFVTDQQFGGTVHPRVLNNCANMDGWK